VNYFVNIPVHAHEQIKFRFPGETVDVHAEVNAALVEGRWSTTRPIASDSSYPDCVYVWTPDRMRVYAIKVDRYDETQWCVVTALRPSRTQLDRWAVR
jgi:hypothetical protein